ncbi:MAG: wax ester/triacylglycerol synthase family O-acyltransferase [Acidimicrobiia bacterium]|nr:wax ester/triacylglycerol synthase family O-acyltransferase [Acidimicrobiia bacterium]
MRRLAGEDSQFIFQESRVQHQHTMKIVVVDPAGAHRALTYERFRQGIGEMIPHTEPFRWRLVMVPLRLGHPYWIDDPDLDLDYHVQRARVPGAGGRRELAEVISTIASVGLQRDRPLWQAWMVDGLEGGLIAFVMKVHHALADGVSSAQLLLDLLSDSPEPMPEPQPLVLLEREAPPARLRLLASAAGDIGHEVTRLPALAGSVRRWASAASGQRKDRRQDIARSFTVPKMRWNAPLTPHRWFAYDTISLTALKAVKDRLGVTVNDVFLATVAGGCRRYLQAHGELPDVGLTVSIPVSTRPPDQTRRWGNRMTTWMIDLATDIDDPVERVQAISAKTLGARRAREERGNALQHDLMQRWPLWTLLGNWLPRAVVASGDKATYSLIASNVPGPRVPLYADGARVTDVISMGPLVKDLGLNFTGWSYCDNFTIGVVACHEHVPDIWDLLDATVDAFDELTALARSR